ncbi:PDZ domain-containing protein [Bacillus sp. 31A1R]|uniref:PDZ domain-containing protein n=1 Tax=Robertmurraya mangrovi TaxID=3098077 RepID=A0ABU5IXV9_9BACI|nr:PDZ domain-containing protein [Bacillus sp. 31A1R]MDZ5471995.1 PDZ domain-containing protein [Bacillus sp. 31A1R]
MAQDWLIELLKGTGKFFLHPIFYYLLFMAAVLGVSRVKRERSNFHIRAENAYFELRQLLPIGILIGLGLSVLTIGVGLVVPMAAVIFVAFFTVLWSLTTKVRLLSPGYTIGFAFFVTLLAGSREWSIPFFSDILNALDGEIYPSIAALLALLVIGEGILILKNGSKGSSPKLIKSKRGQRVGVHEVKRVWMLPVFLLIPGSAIQIPFEWWPVFNVGDQAYSLLLVPFAVGFHQQVQGMLPKEAISILGKRVIALGIFLVLFSVGSYWIPTLSIAVVALAIIGRELLTLSQRLSEENLPFYFSKRNHGVMILGIIPDSPAFKMALGVGELVTKVNGTHVHDEQGFYEALQRNRAHCKLEVIDTNGEIRFVQRALYEGDHHELGILFVQEEKKWDTKAV